MSRTYAKLTNKHQNYPKVTFQEYLYDTNEPRVNVMSRSSAEIERELQEDITTMRKRFRHLAHRMKSNAI